ncbi:hypothetical protein AVEN_270477-1 [Araneus ventricosus]|uniref:Uncharacterized protein n=1 Tax=Araneus ventricosus TaxID=182803 RepID=A0A4Y2B6Y4_ARAVE|nr:hypothetical protein AVEN_270477-1 [Araneus ventricosus]
MARARDTLLGAKHRRKRPLQRWQLTCLGRDSNERPNRHLYCSLGIPSQLSDIATKPYLPLVWPFMAEMGTDAIFMDDSALPHRARSVRNYLESEAIPQMAWSARSPDLNPIEHVWDMLRRWIVGRSVPPGSLQAFQQALLQDALLCITVTKSD